MEEIKRVNNETLNENIPGEEDFGYLIWKLHSLEEFAPCYKTMIEKRKED